jgi:hypothetical protein
MDLETLLTEAAPSRQVPVEGPESPAAAILYQRITGQARRGGNRRRAWSGRANATVLKATVVTAAVVTAAIIVALVLIPGPIASPGQPDTAAAAVLDRAAVTATRQPAGLTPGPGQYVYVKTLVGGHGVIMPGEWRGSTPPIGQPCTYTQTAQFWVAPDGSGRELGSTSPCEGSDVQTQAFAAGSQNMEVYPYAASLSTDPAALETFIQRQYEGGATDNGATYHFAGTFLQSGAPPNVRAALYRLIAGLPGVEWLGPMADRLGRPGIGVGYTGDGIRDVLIFDPATSAVLEREGVAVAYLSPAVTREPAIWPGEVVNYTVYATSAVVNSITALPGGS